MYSLFKFRTFRSLHVFIYSIIFTPHILLNPIHVFPSKLPFRLLHYTRFLPFVNCQFYSLPAFLQFPVILLFTHYTHPRPTYHFMYSIHVFPLFRQFYLLPAFLQFRVILLFYLLHVFSRGLYRKFLTLRTVFVVFFWER